MFNSNGPLTFKLCFLSIAVSTIKVMAIESWILNKSKLLNFYQKSSRNIYCEQEKVHLLRQIDGKQENPMFCKLNSNDMLYKTRKMIFDLQHWGKELHHEEKARNEATNRL